MARGWRWRREQTTSLRARPAIQDSKENFMQIVNVHQRLLNASPERVGALIDSLSSRNDMLWPHENWPRIRLDRALGVGAAGGHGPIRYTVEAYAPGHSVRCRFTGPKGLS